MFKVITFLNKMLFSINIFIHRDAQLALGEIAYNLRLSLLKIGYECQITNTIFINKLNILFGMQDEVRTKTLAYIPQNSIIVNLEQLYDNSIHCNPDYLKILQKYRVWDYNKLNIKWLKTKLNIDAELLILGYQPEITRIKHNPETAKDIDVLFYGCINHRRNDILNKIRNHPLINNVVVTSVAFAEDRDNLIARSKIVINLHYHDSFIFEYFRVSFLLANNCFVISEDCSNMAEYDFLRDGLVVVKETISIADIIAYYLYEPVKRTEIANKGFTIMQKYKSQIPLKTDLNKKHCIRHDLDIDFYLSYYPDLLQNGITPYTASMHYDKHGKYENDLTNLLHDNYNFVYLYKLENGSYTVVIGGLHNFNFIITNDNFQSMYKFIQKLPLIGVFINHCIDFKIPVINNILQVLKLPYIIIIHDYAYLSVDVHNPDKYIKNMDIELLLTGSTYNIVPSNSCYNIYHKHMPNIIFNILPHQLLTKTDIIIAPNKPDKIKILVIGTIFSKIKGSDIIKTLDLLIENTNIEISILGFYSEGLKNIKFINMYYGDADFKEKMENIDCQIIFIPSMCDETFCYTFTLACQMQKIVMTYDFNIFKEHKMLHILNNLILLDRMNPINSFF